MQITHFWRIKISIKIALHTDLEQGSNTKISRQQHIQGSLTTRIGFERWRDSPYLGDAPQN